MEKARIFGQSAVPRGLAGWISKQNFAFTCSSFFVCVYIYIVSSVR